jgi:hypothetical protein
MSLWRARQIEQEAGRFGTTRKNPELSGKSRSYEKKTARDCFNTIAGDQRYIAISLIQIYILPAH